MEIQKINYNTALLVKLRKKTLLFALRKTYRKMSLNGMTAGKLFGFKAFWIFLWLVF